MYVNRLPTTLYIGQPLECERSFFRADFGGESTPKAPRLATAVTRNQTAYKCLLIVAGSTM